ncbi:MAG: hypothetical protein PHZ00_01020 [Candidatus Peribacteraceae bacterium]|nr:hypothetical protein [Candidatus Peribacteraceae bacterium]
MTLEKNPRWRTNWNEATPVVDNPSEGSTLSNALETFGDNSEMGYGEGDAVRIGSTVNDTEDFELGPPEYHFRDTNEHSGSQVIHPERFVSPEPPPKSNVRERMNFWRIRVAALIGRCLRRVNTRHPATSTVSAPEKSSYEYPDIRGAWDDTVASDLGYPSDEAPSQGKAEIISPAKKDS